MGDSFLLGHRFGMVPLAKGVFFFVLFFSSFLDISGLLHDTHSLVQVGKSHQSKDILETYIAFITVIQSDYLPHYIHSFGIVSP